MVLVAEWTYTTYSDFRKYVVHGGQLSQAEETFLEHECGTTYLQLHLESQAWPRWYPVLCLFRCVEQNNIDESKTEGSWVWAVLIALVQFQLWILSDCVRQSSHLTFHWVCWVGNKGNSYRTWCPGPSPLHPQTLSPSNKIFLEILFDLQRLRIDLFSKKSECGASGLISDYHGHLIIFLNSIKSKK